MNVLRFKVSYLCHQVELSRKRTVNNIIFLALVTMTCFQNVVNKIPTNIFVGSQPGTTAHIKININMQNCNVVYV
jgi:hypothetical protein